MSRRHKRGIGAGLILVASAACVARIGLAGVDRRPGIERFGVIVVSGGGGVSREAGVVSELASSRVITWVPRLDAGPSFPAPGSGRAPT